MYLPPVSEGGFQLLLYACTSLVPMLLPPHAMIQRMTFDQLERESASQRSYMELLCGRREEPGNEATLALYTGKINIQRYIQSLFGVH